MSLEIVTYLYQTYVPKQKQFAKFTIKDLRNYSLTVTSRTKGAHAQIKVFLKNQFTNLFELHTQL